MTILLLLAQLAQSGMATNSVSPPPAVVVTLEPSPPASGAIASQPSRPVQTVSSLDPFRPLQPVTVNVRITAGGELLMGQQLRVARYNASAILQRYDAPENQCPPGSVKAAQSSLTFQINREASKTPDEFFMGLTWSRPLDECHIGGSRGISMAQAVTIRRGKTTVVNGDGGLRLELSRP